MESTIQQSFDLNILIMFLAGIYPSERHPKLQQLKGFALYSTMLLLSISLMVYKIIKEGNSEEIQNNFTMAYLGQMVTFSFKLLPFILNGNQMKKCIHYFGYPRFLPEDQEEKAMIDRCIFICKMMSKIFFWFLFFTLIISILPAYIVYKQPVDVWLPYETSNNLIFHLTFIYLSAVSIYGAICGTMVDPLMAGLTYHATTQMKILKHNLQNLHKYSKQENSKIRYEDVAKQLQNCVVRHNLILRFFSQYENCFSFSLFSQIAGSMFGVCFCCVGYILSTTFLAKLKNIVYAIVISNQILFYCYFGTILMEESDDFINGIFMGNWYNCDVKIQKVLILMMERSKKPIILRAGKILDLKLQTFMSLLKTSYSLIAVFSK